jgi:hypothetical protein
MVALSKVVAPLLEAITSQSPAPVKVTVPDATVHAPAVESLPMLISAAEEFTSALAT